ncbi:MAG: hypothetical protein RLZZ108_999 [Actinomycetota bacterium]
MKTNSRNTQIAAFLLLGAFLANGWLQVTQWQYAIDAEFIRLLTDVTSSTWLSQVLYFPQALFLSFAALIGAIVALAGNRRWAAIGGSIGFLALLPLGFIADLVYFLQVGAADPLAEAIRWATPTKPQGFLYYFGLALAAAALVVALSVRNKKTAVTVEPVSPIDVALEAPVKPVAYDTQTGRPILGYDTQTGKPIYADE